MSKINLLIIATGNYTQFLPQFLESAEKYFLKNHEVHYCIFTDYKGGLLNAEMDGKATIYPVEHKPWPWATLRRFHFFLEHKNNLPDADYLYYCDVDSRFVAPIGEEILGSLTAVQHCGYCDGQNLPFETNENSIAYVHPSDRKQYFGGGCFGGSTLFFWPLVESGARMVGIDEANGIVPVWHDESILNKYFSVMPPTVVLSPSYHWPEDNPHVWNKWARYGVSFEPKILLLNKNHAEVRNA